MPPTGLATDMLHVYLYKEFASDSDRPFTLDVTFHAPNGFTILFGPSGSGKTLTLQMLAGLQRPDRGRIYLDQQAFFDSEKRVCLSIRQRRVGYVFQNLALFPHMTVLANVTYGLNTLSKQERHERASQMLQNFGIEHLARRRPFSLSGGEQQRVALARALVTRPRVLLLDEPLSALDMAVKRSILTDLFQINQREQIPILYVTHERKEAITLGHHLWLFDGGKIIAQGKPVDVLEHPQHETVANLEGIENLFEARVIALHPEKGTMSCSLGTCKIEAPFLDWPLDRPVRLGLRGGDILISVEKPVGLSAQNLLPGRILAIEEFDREVRLSVDCGNQFHATVTPSALESLQLSAGQEVWLVIKTHSWHILR